ncbi:hypothetical protein [Methanooceanicella nereidis]|nr:hypothetical protein [Methanocella sp. CWC-04]
MHNPSRYFLIIICIIAVTTLVCGCCGLFPQEEKPALTRAQTIPADVVKMGPETDDFAPIVHSYKWEKPVPLEGPINTAGAEDSPFITSDGNTFYFFFTPDVRVPVEKQIIDGVTGVYVSKKVNGAWTEPERFFLNGDLSMDGCICLQGDTMWFASVRTGNYGQVDVYTARNENGKWVDWTNAGEQLNKQYDIGEFHVTPDGNTIYFGWSANGTDTGSIWEGNRDIYKSEKVNGVWSQPVSLGPNVNSQYMDDQPFISADGNELWFTGQSRLGYTGPAVFRSVKMQNGEWGPAEEIVSNFAGEPTLDAAGNIYFIHHYYKDGNMIEADVYVARKK